MRKLLLLLALGAAPVAAQQHDVHAARGADSAKASVLKVVQSRFTGMRTGDSAMVRAAFHPRASLATTLVDTRQRTGCPGQP